MDPITIGIGLAIIIGFFALRGKKGGGGGSNGKGILYNILRWDQTLGGAITQGQERGFLARFKRGIRAPFHTRWVNGVLRITPQNVKEVVKKQMSYLLSAGVTSQTFNGPPNSIAPGSYGLLKGLAAYLGIKIKSVLFNWAIFGKGKTGNWSKEQVSKMVREHVALMKSPKWTRYQGRPVLYVLRPRKFNMPKLVSKIRAECKKQKVTKPWIVAQRISHSYKYAAEFKKAGFDGFSDYSGGYGAGTQAPGKGNAYKTATGILIRTMKASAGTAKKHGLVYFPTIAPAWNPIPRKLGKKKYHHYKDPAPGEWTDRLRKASAVIKSSGGHVAKVLNIYGLGENSEGGTIMPTMGKAPKYIPDTRMLVETRKAIKGK